MSRVSNLVMRARFGVWSARAGQPIHRAYASRGFRLTAQRGSRFDIGPHTVFERQCSVHLEGQLEIGSECFFNEGLHLVCVEKVTIGNRVRCGERVSIHDENHVFEPWPGGDRAQMTSASVSIGDDVWLGANVTVLPGASIGAGTVVGANSVVRGEIPAGVLAAGIPARVIRALTAG